MIVKVDAKDMVSPFCGYDFEDSHVPALASYARQRAVFRNFFAQKSVRCSVTYTLSISLTIFGRHDILNLGKQSKRRTGKDG